MGATLSFAWRNLARGDRWRFAASVSGAAVAIFIVLLHVAFLRAVEHKATQLYGLFDADVVLVSEGFQFLYRTGHFPLARLRQALSVPGVAQAASVRLGGGSWTAERTQAESTLLLIGVDADPQFARDAELRAALPELKVPRRALVDRLSEGAVGPLAVGGSGAINQRPVEIAGLYSLGLPMYAAATAIVGAGEFARYTGRDPQRTELGLLRLAPGADPAQTAARVRAALPPDVRVMTFRELAEHEAHYFVEVKPLGIMMRAGLLIGLMVGAVALFQVMSSQAEARVRDFAVLRAMGFGGGFGYAVAAWQLALMGTLAFGGAWLAAIPAFAAIAAKSQLAMPLDAWLFGVVLALCLPMAAAAATPLLRAGRSDPASLFGT
jgi:putative ABC transport system permease protein